MCLNHQDEDNINNKELQAFYRDNEANDFQGVDLNTQNALNLLQNPGQNNEEVSDGTKEAFVKLMKQFNLEADDEASNSENE